MKKLLCLIVACSIILCGVGCASNISVEEDMNNTIVPMKTPDSYLYDNDATSFSPEQPTPSQQPTAEIIAMSCAFSTYAVIKSDNSLWMWGNNDFGQIGNGTFEKQEEPMMVLDDVVSVSLHKGITCARKTDGSLWIWGSNRYGQIGNMDDGDSVNRNNIKCQTSPVKIMDDVLTVKAGEGCIAVIKKDQGLYIWGNNTYGICGSTDSFAFIPCVRIMNDVCAVEFGDANIAAIKTDGSLWTWGSNCSGSLGIGSDGDMDNHCSPTCVLEDVVSVQCAGNCGFQNTVAIKKDGSLWAWGGNQYGQVGPKVIGNGLDAWGREAQTKPTKLFDSVLSVCLGSSDGSNLTVTAAITNDYKLKVWGYNSCGAIGNGLKEDGGDFCELMDGALKVVNNFQIGAAIKDDGSLWLWGDIDLGSGAPSIPVKIDDNALDCYLCGRMLFVLKNDGKLYRYIYSTKSYAPVF